MANLEAAKHQAQPHAVELLGQKLTLTKSQCWAGLLLVLGLLFYLVYSLVGKFDSIGLNVLGQKVDLGKHKA